MYTVLFPSGQTVVIAMTKAVLKTYFSFLHKNSLNLELLKKAMLASCTVTSLSMTQPSGYPTVRAFKVLFIFPSYLPVPLLSCNTWENISSVVQIQPLTFRLNKNFSV